jgi:hypothetical protein
MQLNFTENKIFVIRSKDGESVVITFASSAGEGVPTLARILFITLTNFFVTWAQFFRSQTSTGTFSSVSRPIFATKFALERP